MFTYTESYTEKKAVHKSYTERKLCIGLPAILQLHAAHLINLKMNENIIEEKTLYENIL